MLVAGVYYLLIIVKDSLIIKINFIGKLFYFVKSSFKVFRSLFFNQTSMSYIFVEIGSGKNRKI